MERFMTAGWAEACRDAVNAWPSAEHKASKLQDFWDWIAMVSPFVTGVLALSVDDRPPGADGDTLVLELTEGRPTSATISQRTDVEDRATFLLAGSLPDWMDLVDGADPGKTLMYRKLMLRKGETLQFFTAVFFWTELLTAIQTVPTEVLQLT